ncbi:AbrB/MazE/SpoVT family DNA-binding domain-containing protein [Propioniciclava coleopterorum]|uniref:AbrB/MazE/SpoVT family DNA-binding domain-containing protein n=1 Tax=Propioniciclava coleopterorum TaxID=2714937 RepID=A0A6G7Y7C4_9ACTN|nr:AbrB/MazE/SpoVT family DNA-binding domain-containing protein [Propioniciclava coleopterorum]QIK72548.1 AbrB/MazE/SpoVT family DNA-binding domain-containing protein [Propioniciclava coleopterorum]
MPDQHFTIPSGPPPAGRLAATVKVGAKGQIVIPQDARDMFGIRPGDTLLLLADVERGIAIVRNDVFRGFTDAALDHAAPPFPPKDPSV